MAYWEQLVGVYSFLVGELQLDTLDIRILYGFISIYLFSLWDSSLGSLLWQLEGNSITKFMLMYLHTGALVSLFLLSAFFRFVPCLMIRIFPSLISQFNMYFLVGFQVLAFFLRPNHEVKTRKYWNWYHHWVGRIALFFGALNIVLGIQIGNAGNSWKISYGFLLAAVLITVFVLEALLFMRKSEKLNENPAFQMNPVI